MKVAIIFALLAVASALPRTLLSKGSVNVIGGEKAGEREFPFHASILLGYSLIGYIPVCGAAIYDEKRVITGAACASYLSPPLQYRLAAADHDFAEDDGNEQFRNITSILIHENYTRSTKENDIAILTLETPLIFNNQVQPIRLAESSSVASGDVETCGYSAAEEEGISPVLSKATFTVLNNDECQHDFESIDDVPDVTQGMICAFATEKTINWGDYGGPLVAKDEAGRKYLAGIGSWGAGQGRDNIVLGYPSVFTNIATYRDWLDSNLNP